MTQRSALAYAAIIFTTLVPFTCGHALEMSTSMQFAVSDSGAATISVPIKPVRGLAGMEPQVSLNYSSSSANGLLGVGWTLSGVSAITRCPKDILTDNVRGSVTFGSGDRYCLDGVRLEAIATEKQADGQYGTDGVEYRLARDSFSRIKSFGSVDVNRPWVPARFVVETKSGLIMEFGLDASSRVMTNFVSGVTTPATVNRWMLQRISDRQIDGGNAIEFVYCGGEVAVTGECNNMEGTANWSGSKVIHYIRYTKRSGNAGENAIVFRYESRPDVVRVYHKGSMSSQTQRMIGLDIYRNYSPPAVGQKVRTYSFNYEPLTDAQGASTRATNVSRLVSVQEAGYAYSGGQTQIVSMPPLQFFYPADTVFSSTGVVAQVAGQLKSSVIGPINRGCGGVVGSKTKMMCP